VRFKTVSRTQLLVVKQVAYFLIISAAINYSKKTLLHAMSYSFKLVLRSDTGQMLCTHYEIQIVEAIVTEQ